MVWVWLIAGTIMVPAATWLVSRACWETSFTHVELAFVGVGVLLAPLALSVILTRAIRRRALRAWIRTVSFLALQATLIFAPLKLMSVQPSLQAFGGELALARRMLETGTIESSKVASALPAEPTLSTAPSTARSESGATREAASVVAEVQPLCQEHERKIAKRMLRVLSSEKAGHVLWELAGPAAPMNVVQTFDGGKKVAFGRNDGAFAVHDAATGAELFVDAATRGRVVWPDSFRIESHDVAVFCSWELQGGFPECEHDKEGCKLIGGTAYVIDSSLDVRRIPRLCGQTTPDRRYMIFDGDDRPKDPSLLDKYTREVVDLTTGRVITRTKPLLPLSMTDGFIGHEGKTWVEQDSNRIVERDIEALGENVVDGERTPARVVLEDAKFLRVTRPAEAMIIRRLRPASGGRFEERNFEVVRISDKKVLYAFDADTANVALRADGLAEASSAAGYSYVDATTGAFIARSKQSLAAVEIARIGGSWKQIAGDCSIFDVATDEKDYKGIVGISGCQYQAGRLWGSIGRR